FKENSKPCLIFMTRQLNGVKHTSMVMRQINTREVRRKEIVVL
ncbi:6892_t:CDS:1, partial [Funneliformis geosporum]